MSDRNSVREIIEDHNNRLMKWYRTGEIDKVAELFSEDCWQMSPHAPPMVGREALREGWKQAILWGQWNFDLSTQDVVVSGAIAVERGNYVLKFTAGPGAPSGMNSSEDHGNYVALWRQENDGAWRIVWDAPASEAPIP